MAQQTELSLEEANELVIEHQGWAESIARSVARAWNLDWRIDGLDGAAMEALIFCARRFNPSMGVPFRGYARKRIHEASTEAAKKSKGWRKGQGSQFDRSREISEELLNIYPEIREGDFPTDADDARGAVRQLLMGANILAAKYCEDAPTPEAMVDYKRMVSILASLEPVHQLLLWKVYWEGLSLRNVAAEWDTDGLNVIREHKTVVEYLHKNMSVGKQFLQRPKVRPGLKTKSADLKKGDERGPFSELMEKS